MALSFGFMDYILTIIYVDLNNQFVDN